MTPQPTPHQTNIYNQMMAQQQVTFSDSNRNISDMSISSPQGTNLQTTSNNFSPQSNAITTGQNILNNQQQLQDMASKMISMLHPSQMNPTQFAQMHSHSLPINLNPQQQIGQQISSVGPISTSTQDIYKSQHGQPPYKIPSQSSGGFNPISRVKHSPPHVQSSLQQQQNSIKDMYRSNSLPLNSTVVQLQSMSKEDSFAMPRYQASKGQRGSSSQQQLQQQQQQQQQQQYQRGRSNSMIMRPANSEPVLTQNLNASSALLAQLLTTNHGLMGKNQLQPQQLQSTSVSNTPPLQTPQSSSSSSYLYSVINSPDSAIDQDLPLSPERTPNTSKFQPRESQRRAGHIHAEQKRRYNIKNGFDMLHSLIPQLQQNPNAKVR
jgi:MAX-like protein X